MTAPTAAARDADTRDRVEIHCETCAHPVNPARSTVCVAHGHVLSVVEIRVTTFNAPARPFTAAPAAYLGSSGDWRG